LETFTIQEAGIIPRALAVDTEERFMPSESAKAESLPVEEASFKRPSIWSATWQFSRVIPGTWPRTSVPRLVFIAIPHLKSTL
jgi:hypothetical protein